MDNMTKQSTFSWKTRLWDIK